MLNGQKSEKVHFLKCTFWVQKYFGTQKFLSHVKIKSKLNYLGKKITILPNQMTEKLSVEVDVKKCDEGAGGAQPHLFG